MSAYFNIHLSYCRGELVTRPLIGREGGNSWEFPPPLQVHRKVLKMLVRIGTRETRTVEDSGPS